MSVLWVTSDGLKIRPIKPFCGVKSFQCFKWHPPKCWAVVELTPKWEIQKCFKWDFIEMVASKSCHSERVTCMPTRWKLYSMLENKIFCTFYCNKASCSSCCKQLFQIQPINKIHSLHCTCSNVSYSLIFSYIIAAKHV